MVSEADKPYYKRFRNRLYGHPNSLIENLESDNLPENSPRFLKDNGVPLKIVKPLLPLQYYFQINKTFSLSRTLNNPASHGTALGRANVS